MIILLGYKTKSRHEEPAVVYIGRDGVAANQAIEQSPYPRIEKLHHPITMPVRRWDDARAKAMEEADEKAKLRQQRGKAKGGKQAADAPPKLPPAAESSAAPQSSAPTPEPEPIPQSGETEDGPQLSLPGESSDSAPETH